MDFYVYLHRKATTGEVFYVGKGRNNRCFSTNGRSKHWYRVKNKHGITVEIVQDGLQEWAAFELERDLISLYGRKDLKLGNLINRTDGGEGASGVLMSKETKNKISISRLGPKNPMYGRSITDYEIEEKRRFMLDKWLDDEYRTKVIASRIGKKRTDKAKFNISNSKLGAKNPMYGKTGKSHPNSKKVVCLHNNKVFCSVKSAADWAAEFTGMKSNSGNIVTACKHGKNAYGYKWSYAIQ